ncbi:hypothetical protein ACJX0J_025292, partial [Zea mays]
MVYHSSFADDDGITKACSCPLLPLKTHIKGPAPASDPDKADIVDEAITFFRANVFFKNFHVKCSADKLLIYLTFYINIALKRLEGCRTLAVGTKAIINLGLEKVPVPGEPGFPFPGLFTLPQSQEEAELLRNYLKQIREETKLMAFQTNLGFLETKPHTGVYFSNVLTIVLTMVLLTFSCNYHVLHYLWTRFIILV